MNASPARYTTCVSKRRLRKSGPPVGQAAAASTSLEHVSSDSHAIVPLGWPLTLVTVLIVSLAGIRGLVPVSPNEYWDTNPVQNAASATANSAPTRLSFDVGEAAWLDVMAVFVAGLALLFHVRAGGRIHWLSIALASVGMAFCALQMPTHIESLYKCGSWIASCAMAVAALHLAQRDEQRRWFVAGLMALAFPMAVDASWYVTVDHPFMVDMFTEQEADWLKARGWEQGSPQHLQYRRRLEFNDATGAFSFSNVLGSVMAALGVLATAVAIGAAVGREKLMGWKWKTLLPALFAIAAFVTVMLTNSKGAAIATVMVAGLLGVILLARKRISLRRWIAPLACCLVGIAILVVVVRGLAGPPQTSEGERSLLFRWHYWQATARMVTADAQSLTVGVPPGEFQERYAAAKNPINPEEVGSAHNVFIDQIAMLGMGGWAWTVLMLTWLWKSGRGVADALDSDEHDPPTNDAKPDVKSIWQVDERNLLFAGLMALFILGGQLVKRWAGVDDIRLLVWSIGLFAFLVGSAFLATPSWTKQRWVTVGLFLAATLLLIHNQIEMTFHQPGSAPIAWLLLAVAAAPAMSKLKKSSDTRWPQYLPAVYFLLAVIPMARLYAYPLANEQKALATADANLRQRKLSIQTLRLAVNDLRVAEQALAIDPKPYEWQVRLRLRLAEGTYSALSGKLSEQQKVDMRRTIRIELADAINTLDRANEAGLTDGKLLRLRAETFFAAGNMLNDAKLLDQAIAVWQQLVANKPYSWQVRKELADLLWKVNRRREAIEHYKACFKISDDAYLDEARQMPASLIEVMNTRIKAGSSSHPDASGQP